MLDETIAGRVRDLADNIDRMCRKGYSHERVRDLMVVDLSYIEALCTFENEPIQPYIAVYNERTKAARRYLGENPKE